MPNPQPAEVYKLSSILTSTRTGGTECFETLDDMPPVMRAECVRALGSDHTATVVIADAAGRQYLLTTMVRETAVKSPDATAFRRFPWRLAAEIVFVGVAGLALWVLATLR